MIYVAYIYKIYIFFKHFYKLIQTYFVRSKSIPVVGVSLLVTKTRGRPDKLIALFTNNNNNVKFTSKIIMYEMFQESNFYMFFSAMKWRD